MRTFVPFVLFLFVAGACSKNIKEEGDASGEDGETRDSSSRDGRQDSERVPDSDAPGTDSEGGGDPDGGADAVDAAADDGAGAEDVVVEEIACGSSTECDDLNPCNGVETCDSSRHVCVGGTPPADGFVCGTGPRKICLDGACAASTCGDGFVDGGGGEQCEPPSTGACVAGCRWACSEAGDCPDDANPCNGEEHCDTAAHACARRNVPADGTACGSSPRRICLEAVCRISACGDGFADAGATVPEECDDYRDGDPADGCRDDCTFSCHGAGDCDDGRVCTVDDCDTRVSHACTTAPRPSSFLCRGASGACDVEERCDGSAADCPADALASTAQLCRVAAGVCDIAERCAGTSASCPADAFVPSGGPCDDSLVCTTEQCDGGGRCVPSPVPGCCGFGAVDAGGYHTCGLLQTGAVKCWGDNYYGQVGDGTSFDRRSPVQVAGLTGGVAMVSAGRYFTCVLASAGSVRCWGNNESGEIGDGTLTHRSTPVQVLGLAAGVRQVAAGGWHACALLETGVVKCWGENENGQLGDGTNSRRTSPSAVYGLSTGVAAVAVGSRHSCALMSTGAVKCWGLGSDGELGNGGTSSYMVPVDVTGLTARVAQLALGRYHSCALLEGGAAVCWGDNYYGAVGDGSWTDRSSPVRVLGLSSGVAALTGSEFHFTCALLSSGAAKCWGENYSGQLGNGGFTGSNSPVQVLGLTSGVAAVTAGGYHACAYIGPTSTKCWGWNGSGQLGDWTTSTRTSPVAVVCP